MLERRSFLVSLGALLLPNAVRAERFVEPEAAARLIFPSADRIAPFALTLSGTEKKEIRQKGGMRVRKPQVRGFDMHAGAMALGRVYLDEVIGKHEFITYAAGVDKGGTVAGVEIIEYRETWGYEIRRPQWRRQFRGRTLDDPLRLGKDIENISGATLSCRNVTDGVRRLLATHAILAAR